MKFTPPGEIEAVLTAFAPLFSRPTWQRVQVLLCGAMLSSSSTITAALRVLGLGMEPHFGSFHRVLNRAKWSAFKAGPILLNLLLKAFAPADGPLVFGLDDTVERRWGKSITARAIYRDPVRSSRTSMQKTSGLRWMSVQLLVPIGWARRIWALPVLTALAPSERYEPYREKGRVYKSLPRRAVGLLGAIWRWMGPAKRRLIFVADKTYAAMDLLAWCSRVSKRDPSRPLGFITRLRLDAALYDPAPARRPGQKGRRRLKGKRQPALKERLKTKKTKWQRVRLPWYGSVGVAERTVEIASGEALWYHVGVTPVPIRWVLIRDPEEHFNPQALICTDRSLGAKEIVGCFVRRWQMEVTFEEANAHLGLPGQRQWSDRAIERSTPMRLGLFSLVSLIAEEQERRGHPVPVRCAAWYHKALPTFSDALAATRRLIWAPMDFPMSPCDPDLQKTQREFFSHMVEMLCHGP